MTLGAIVTEGGAGCTRTRAAFRSIGHPVASPSDASRSVRAVADVFRYPFGASGGSRRSDENRGRGEGVQDAVRRRPNVVARLGRRAAPGAAARRFRIVDALAPERVAARRVFPGDRPGHARLWRLRSAARALDAGASRSEEHTSELQSLM